MTDIASMVHRTDIPDWCFVECGLPDFARGAKIPSAEELLAMRRVAHCALGISARLCYCWANVTVVYHQASGSTLPSDACAWSRCGKTVCTNHAVSEGHTHIDTPSSEADAWLHILFFLRQHVF